jgi:DNA-binding MarR family transcriptional regulator
MAQTKRKVVSEILEARLRYAGMGLHTFLIRPGTRASYLRAQDDPHGRRWGATNEPDEIRQQCEQCHDAEPGLGIATGPVSGIWVCDYESVLGHGVDGIGERSKLENEYGKLPETLSAATATAGRHDYWRLPNGLVINTSKGILRPGIDVLSDGNMVVAPPTIRHGRGVYRWLNAGTSIVEAPEWLVKLAIEAGARNGKYDRAEGTKSDDAIPDFLADTHADFVGKLMSLIPNNDYIGTPNLDNFEFDWEAWNTMLMRLYHTTNGSLKGLQIAHEWTLKHSDYNAKYVDDRWRAYAGSPPKEVSIASIHWYARRADPDRYLDYVEEYNATVDRILFAKMREANDRATGGSGQQEERREEVAQERLLKSSAEFVDELTPPDYLIDGFLQRRFLYSLTGLTGSGKTAIVLRLAANVALGRAFGGREVETGRVLFFAGENPVDVRMRWIKICEELKVEPSIMDVHFLDGAMPIGDVASNRAVKREGMLIRAQIESEVEALGGVSLVIIDTNTAYFRGEDENDNVEAAAHARMLRSFVELDGGPTVLVTCHPTKNASLENLLPRGGGAFVNEVDGNLVSIRQLGSQIVTVETHGKFRGPEFAPIPFKIVPGTSDKLVDTKGRKIWTVIATEITDNEQEAMDDAISAKQEALLAAIDLHPSSSLTQLADLLGWKLQNGDPNKSLVARLLKKSAKEKLVELVGNRYQLTPKGKKRLEELKERSV